MTDDGDVDEWNEEQWPDEVVNAFLQVVGRHGCAADMEHLSHYSATEIFVRENGESCWQVDDASLDPNHGQGNATIFQVRLIVRSIFQV